jgi:hypothetical protein
LIKGKFSPSLQSKARANTTYSFAKASIDYNVVKAVIKYSLATAYSYLDEKGLNKLYKDIVTSLDSILIETTFNRTFDDGQNVTTQTLINTAKVLSDILTSSDNFNYTTTFNRLFGESQSQLDASFFNVIKVLADSVVPIEVKSLTLNKNLSDAVSNIDNKTFSFIKALVDQSIITDRATLSFTKRPSDSQSQLDTFNRIVSYLRSPNDNQPQSDTLNRTVNYSRNFSDIVTIPDRIVSIFFADEGDIVDPFSVADRASLTLVKPLSGDTYSGFVDSYSSTFITSRSDQSSPSDNFSRIANYLRSFSETRPVLDSFSRTVTFNRLLADLQITQDEFARAVQYFRTYADSQEQADQKTITFNALKQDSSQPIDDKTISSGKILSDTSVSTEQIQNIDYTTSKIDNQEQSDTNTYSLDKLLDNDNQLQSDTYSSDIQPVYEDFQEQTDETTNIDVQPVYNEEQNQEDTVDYTSEYNREYTDTQEQTDQTTNIDTEKQLDVEYVLTIDVVDILYIIGRDYADEQLVSDTFNRSVQYDRTYVDSYTLTDFSTFDYALGTRTESIYSADNLTTLQYYKYLNESQLQQDSGSSVTSDYVTNYGDYFSEYYVGEVRTF